MGLSSHDFAQLMCRPGTRVLDVGCGPGTVADRMAVLGCEIVGLDIDPANVAAMQAKSYGAHLCDLDNDDLSEVLGDERFDTIVCLDVLEHTKDAARVLSALIAHLEDDGDVIISLPNVSHGDVRLALLEGRFEYTDEGLLDATHLHFFNRGEVESLLADSGLVARDPHTVRFPLGGTEVGVDLDQVDPAILEVVSADPDSTVYQWIVRAQRSDATDHRPPLVDALAGVEEQAATQAAAERYAIELLAAVGEATSHSDLLSVELTTASEYAERLQTEVAERDAYVESLAARIESGDEDRDLLRREVAAGKDVVDLVSIENDGLQAQVAELGGLAAQREAELVAIKGRRLYRLLDRLSRLRVVKRLARS